MPRRPVFVAAMITAALALAGCAKPTTDRPAQTPTAASYPVTVGAVTLDKQPTKIVSLSPSLTEMLFAIDAGKQVAAVDELSTYPADAPKTDLSGFKPNAEAIAARSPDLVVVSNDINNVVGQLTTLKIPVFLAPAAKTLEDTYAQISDLGKLTGHPDRAADVVKRMKDDIAKLLKDLPQRSKRLTYYHELDPMYYSVTSKTFIGSLYAMAGLDNIADPADASGSAGGYPQLSAEAIIKADPDLIFLAEPSPDIEAVKARPGWSGVAAVRGGRVYAIDPDIASRWGPRVVDLLRMIIDAVAKVPA